jgi:thiamine-phosphate pyrophosphorylase
MSLDQDQIHPVMCLTQDGLPLSHAEQAQRLCAAGARWIQLRMKNAALDTWLATAREVVGICRSHGAICIVNDNVDVAVAANAHGAHLSWRDENWICARKRLGTKKILGGTVNNTADARRVAQADCLDYVGIGPWRFTATKQKLAPVLGAEGVRALIAQLDGLPAWAIGGLTLEDLPLVRKTGAAGAAVSSSLYRDGRIGENFRALVAAWGPIVDTLHS